MDATQKKYLGAGLAALAVVLLLIAMFTSWWTVKIEQGGAENEETVTLFEEGESDQVVTGILALLALLAGVAVAAFVAGHVFEVGALTKWPLNWSLFGTAAVGLLAVVALIFTATAWPDDDRGQEFWGQDEFSGSNFGGFNVPSTTLSYRPGLGWWFELLGAAALVSGTILTWLGAQDAGSRKKVRATKAA